MFYVVDELTSRGLITFKQPCYALALKNSKRFCLEVSKKLHYVHLEGNGMTELLQYARFSLNDLAYYIEYAFVNFMCVPLYIYVALIIYIITC